MPVLAQNRYFLLRSNCTLHMSLQSNEDSMQVRHSHLQSVMQVGEDLIKAGNLGSDKIQQRINDINGQWDNLIDLAAYRKKRLLEAVDFYQVTSSFFIYLI